MLLRYPRCGVNAQGSRCASLNAGGYAIAIGPWENPAKAAACRRPDVGGVLSIDRSADPSDLDRAYRP